MEDEIRKAAACALRSAKVHIGLRQASKKEVRCEPPVREKGASKRGAVLLPADESQGRLLQEELGQESFRQASAAALQGPRTAEAGMDLEPRPGRGWAPAEAGGPEASPGSAATPASESHAGSRSPPSERGEKEGLEGEGLRKRPSAQKPGSCPVERLRQVHRDTMPASFGPECKLKINAKSTFKGLMDMIPNSIMQCQSGGSGPSGKSKLPLREAELEPRRASDKKDSASKPLGSHVAPGSPCNPQSGTRTRGVSSKAAIPWTQKASQQQKSSRDVRGATQFQPPDIAEYGHKANHMDVHTKLTQDVRRQCPNAIAAFNKALAEGEQKLSTVKLCFVGHARAGKTSTLLALAGQAFNPTQPSTHGVDTCSLTQDLLEANVMPIKPWKKGDSNSGSIAKVMEKEIARLAAQQLVLSHTTSSADTWDQDEKSMYSEVHPCKETRGAPREGIPASLPPEILKMPLDLIAWHLEGQAPEERQRVILQTWDFAGQEMYYSMAHVFLTPLGIYALCLDLSAWARHWAETGVGTPSQELVDSVDFWLAAVVVHAPDAHLVIVGTHDDELPEDARPIVQARVNEHLAQRLEQTPSLHRRLCVNEQDQLLFFPVDNSRSSTQGQQRVDHLRATLNKLALEAVEELGCIPTRWAHLFNVLTDHRHEGPKRPCISLEECERIGASLGVQPDEVEQCLVFFHRLGQLLHFPGSPAVVLEPQWLLDAMAQVAACPLVLERHSHRARALRERGELSAELLSVLWAGPRFSGHEATLQTFLQHFDLLVPNAMLAAGAGGEARWLVPSLLPRRSSGLAQAEAMLETAASGEPEAVLVLDFHGALRKLLPSLLLRLLCHLKGREGSALRVFKIYKDFSMFAFGSDPLYVVLDMLPAQAPQVMRVLVHRQPQIGGVAAMKGLVEHISEALLAWMPHLSFSIKLPCPECGAVGEPGCHLLDLSEVLNEETLFCPRASFCSQGRLPLEQRLPAFAREWRSAVRGVSPQAIESQTHTVATPRDGHLRMRFLYASPLARGMQALSELNIQAEVQSLTGLPGISAEVQVATVGALREALVGRDEIAVLHLSAHCGCFPHPALLLEDECSSAHELTEVGLAAMGPWHREGLLVVFLSCGSEQLVRGLVRESGLRRAICCSGVVFDAAARLFCRAFYHALGSGHPLATCHEIATAAVRNSADPGLRSEAGKFLLLESDAAKGSCLRPSQGVMLSRPRWPLWPSVEDYRARVGATMSVARYFLQRRVLLLLGVAGVGKTALCRELCRHFSSPGGRLFSAGAFWLDRSELAAEGGGEGLRGALASALLAEMAARGAPGGSREADAAEAPGSAARGEAAAERPWQALRAACGRLDEAGRWLLVLDGLRPRGPEEQQPRGAEATGPGALRQEEEEEELARALEELLKLSALLCVLVTARRLPRGRCWHELAALKVSSLPLAPLPPQDAAELFLRRVRRPLFAHDFNLAAPSPGAPGGGVPLRMSREPGGLLERLAAAPLMHALGNLPGRIVEAAAQVDTALPSLLQHPALPAAWRASSSDDPGGGPQAVAPEGSTGMSP